MRQVRALFLFRGSGALSNQWKRIMNFNAFWKWLCKQGRIITNLGETGNKEFAIFASSLSGTCFPTKPDQANPFKAGEIQHFSISQAKAVWDRFHTLPETDRLTATLYVRNNWRPCPLPMVCNPWIAAAIRDFLAGKN